jgi:hypothetical protein
MPQFSDDLFLGTAQGYVGTTNTSAEAVITGSVSGTTMTVTAMNSGDSLVLGQYVNGSGITANSYISAFVSGLGGTGTYTLSASSSATGSITIYASGNAGLGDPSPMDVGVGPLGREYVWDVIPQTLQAANIAASQTPAAAGNLTLTAGTSAKSVTRTDGTTVIQLDSPRALQVVTGTAVASTLAGVAITGTGGQISFTSQTGLVSGQRLTISGTYGGTGSITGYSNPTTYILTAVTSTTATLTTTGGAAVVTTAGTPTGLTYTLGVAPQNMTVSGYDYYGQAMTEVITSSASVSTAVNGKKAFYQIASIATAGATGTTITAGTTDILGIPLRVFDAGYVVRVGWNNTLANDSGGNSAFVAADMTTPATSTTGDVRGTYVPSTASNGIKRLVIVIGLPSIAAGPNATRTGVLGVTQA